MRGGSLKRKKLEGGWGEGAAFVVVVVVVALSGERGQP